MPNVSFAQIQLHGSYSRHDLAQLWNYDGTQGLSRGVVTPSGTNYIILFVTGEKQNSYEQYENRLDGRRLQWEGPTDHYAEERVLATGRSEDQIHLFYRERHHREFTYYGRLRLESADRHTGRPSRFIFELIN